MPEDSTDSPVSWISLFCDHISVSHSEWWCLWWHPDGALLFAVCRWTRFVHSDLNSLSNTFPLSLLTVMICARFRCFVLFSYSNATGGFTLVSSVSSNLPPSVINCNQLISRIFSLSMFQVIPQKWSTRTTLLQRRRNVEVKSRLNESNLPKLGAGRCRLFSHWAVESTPQEKHSPS